MERVIVHFQLATLLLLSLEAFGLPLGDPSIAVGSGEIRAAIEPFDPADDRWSYGLGNPFASSLGHAVAFGGEGKVVVGAATTGWTFGEGGQVGIWDGHAWQVLTSIGGAVSAVAVSNDGAIYVGGRFAWIGDLRVNYIARWNGKEWSALGEGLNDDVHTLAFGPEGQLYVGGRFTAAGGQTANRVAVWDGISWAPLEDGVGAPVHALAVGGDGSLYAGGSFTQAGGQSANRIARWNGSAWLPLGTGVSGTVRSLAIGEDATVIAGGEFLAAGGVSAIRIARWNGSSWGALGAGANGNVLAVSVDTDGRVYAAGAFTQIGNIAAERIAMWENEQWMRLDSAEEYADATIRALAVRPDGTLALTGDFSEIDKVAMSRVALWSENGWLNIGSVSPGGLDGEVRALVAGPDGSLYAGGTFSVAGSRGGDGIAAANVARWDGTRWHALDSGIAGQVNALAFDVSGYLYAGGFFELAGGTPARSIARWDGTSWSGLGDGVIGNVRAIVSDGSDGIFVGGNFETAGDASAINMAHWDGTSWTPVGPGLNGTVHALALHPDGGLYAAGAFHSPPRVAMWDGSAWQWLGSGLGPHRAYSLAINPVTGMVYVAGDTGNNIYQWQGGQWYPVGGWGVSGTVRAMSMGSDGGLYVAGEFVSSGPTGSVIRLRRIARWKDGTWTPLGSGFNHTVLALAEAPDGDLWVGGMFTTAGTVPSNYVARWDGMVGVGNEAGALPFSRLSIRSNYPNPVFQQTTISFTVADRGLVVVRAYDLLGRHVQTIAEEELPPGDHDVTWSPDGLAQGSYVVRITVRGESAARIIQLIR